MASTLATVHTPESTMPRPAVGSPGWWVERASALAAGTNCVIGISAAVTSVILPRRYADESFWAIVLSALGFAAAWSYSTFGGVLPSGWLARRRPLALAAGVLGFVAGLPLTITSGTAFIGGVSVWSELLAEADGRGVVSFAVMWTLLGSLAVASLVAQFGAFIRGFRLAFPRDAQRPRGA